MTDTSQTLDAVSALERVRKAEEEAAALVRDAREKAGPKLLQEAEAAAHAEREALLVTVLLAGRSTPGKVESVRKGNTYDLRISGEGGVCTVLVIDRGSIPAIEVH